MSSLLRVLLTASLGLAIPGAAIAQEAKADSVFKVGSCPAHAAGTVNWDEVVTEVDEPARIVFATVPRFPMHLRDDSGVYYGRVVVAMVVDTAGSVMPGTVTIDESTDPKLSAWGCLIAFQMRFTPARKAGRIVNALGEQAFTYDMGRLLPRRSPPPPPLPRNRRP